MPRKRAAASNGETRTSFMFPSLHRDVVNAVSDQITSIWYHKTDSDNNSNNEHPTHVMAKFICNNNACRTRGWGSKMVAIIIRGYPGNGYNAVVFNQRCRSCDQLGTFTLDTESYIDRVAYRIKKWAGLSIEQPHYSQKEGPPHEEELCEGCKRGVCRQTNDWEYY